MTTTTMPGLAIAPIAGSRAPAVLSPADSIEVRHREPVDARDEAAGIDEDPFHDPFLRGIGIVMLIIFILTLALGGLMYWGVQYQSPSWNAHSFPPPVVH